MEKINLVELLRNCPSGMELDCTLVENLYFDCINDSELDDPYSIQCYTQNGSYRTSIRFTEYGHYTFFDNSKCVIFPKGKTTWEGFVPPCKFKDGDVLAESSCIFIIQKLGDNNTAAKTYCTLYDDGIFDDGTILYFDIDSTKPATEEEKQKLFNAIKANGYRWNAETRTLEKLIEPKFHEEDWVVDSQLLIHQIERVVENVTTHTFGYDIVGGGYFNDNNEDIHLWTIEDAKDGDILCTYECDEPKIVFILKGMPKKHYALSYHCYYNVMYPYFAPDTEKGCLAPNDEDVKPATKEQRNLLFQKMKEAGYKWNPDNKTLEKLPKFKVGDTITNGKTSITIGYIDNEYYYEISRNIANRLFIKNQDEWNLVLNKFNINSLVPFETRVLIRNEDNNIWKPAIFGCYAKDKNAPYYTLGGTCWKQCIPYEGNEYLLLKTDDCDEFYRTWEKTGD